MTEPIPITAQNSRASRSAKSSSSSFPGSGSGSGNHTGSGGDASNTSSKDRDRDWSLSSTTTQVALSSIKESLGDTNAHIYDFSEICSATNNLHAAKRFSPKSWRCVVRRRDVVVFQRKFRRPIGLPELRHLLSAICRSHHTSVVKLLGASVAGNYIYLVYDYVSGANLADCLRNPKNPSFTVLSTWLSRMQVAAALADGLDYVHHSTGLGLRFVHNHISSASVVVSETSLNAKICHFGTAVLCGEIGDPDPGGGGGEIEMQRSRSRVVRIEGTKGYMAPEFQATGVASQKTDVYAFGVVLLELLSGKEALRYRVDEETGAYERESVIEGAMAAAAEEGGVRRWMDRRLRDSFPLEVAERMTQIGLDCVDEDPSRRPDMDRVAGAVSRLYLESTRWAEKMRIPADFSVSFAPR